MSTWKDAVEGSSLVVIDEEAGIMVVWNGSATFNVYTHLDNPDDLNPADCFTRYASDGGYGPGDAGMTWREGQSWAKSRVADWFEDNVYGKPDSYYDDLSREDCVEALDGIGTTCYDDEPIEDLREAVKSNVADGTILAEDLP